MSYDLDALPRARRPPVDLGALATTAQALVPVASFARSGAGLVVDGAGFAVTFDDRAAHLSAPAGRGPGDERLMEACALVLAGADGAVLDRHSGRSFPAALLDAWLEVAGLLSGRALAVNEERLARKGEQRGLRGFTARTEALARHAAGPLCAPALRQRIHDELVFYAARPALVWPAARALALLGDFERLESLARVPPVDGGADAFEVAAEFGAAALGLFATALGDADPNHRRAAARALHRVRVPEVLPLVARALEDRRATVREAVLEQGFEAVLALPGAAAALRPVLGKLAQDPSSLVRRMSARFGA